jgi:hypothetical protein
MNGDGPGGGRELLAAHDVTFCSDAGAHDSPVSTRAGVHLDPPPPVLPGPRPHLPEWEGPRKLGLGLGLLLVSVTVALRVPYVGRPLSPDESGFLIVARAWGPGGGSLYGPYWVDRPPLLLELYKLADLAGGQLAVRLLGMAAAATAVLFVALAADRAVGRRAAMWAGVAALGLLSSPILGAMPSNGELLASPFVAVGVWAVVAMLDSHDRRRIALLGFVVGASGAAAVLVKQNMLDVGVFFVVTVVVAVRRGRLPRKAASTALRWSMVGVLAAAGPVLGLAMSLGSGPGQLFYAAYPFRFKASVLMSQHTGSDRVTRAWALVAADLASLGPVVVALLVVLLVRRRLDLDARFGPLPVSVLALTGYATVSVAAGGSYWHHYLVQLAVPTALAAGLVIATRRSAAGRVVVAAMIVSALVAWSGGLVVRPPSGAQDVGAVVRDSARPGDTVVNVLGNADVVLSSGLRSPYPYLWSIPARVLDPSLHGLTKLLAGRQAPTWVVLRGPDTVRWLAKDGAGRVLDHRYRTVVRLCGRIVYLRDGVHRPVPVDHRGPAPTSVCRMPSLSRDGP